MAAERSPAEERPEGAGATSAAGSRRVPTASPPPPSPPPLPPPPVRDRQVVLVAAAVVAVVLGLLALSIYVPAIGQALSSAPLLIAALVAVTVVVLWRAIRPRA